MQVSSAFSVHAVKSCAKTIAGVRIGARLGRLLTGAGHAQRVRSEERGRRHAGAVGHDGEELRGELGLHGVLVRSEPAHSVQLVGQGLLDGVDLPLPGVLVNGFARDAFGVCSKHLLVGLRFRLRRRRRAQQAAVLVEHFLQRGAGRQGQHVRHRDGHRGVGHQGGLDLLAHLLGQLVQQLLRKLAQYLGIDEDRLALGVLDVTADAVDQRAELLGAAFAQGDGVDQAHLLGQQVLLELQGLVGHLLDDPVDPVQRARLHARGERRGHERLVRSFRHLREELRRRLVGVQVHPLVEVLGDGGDLLGDVLGTELPGDGLQQAGVLDQVAEQHLRRDLLEGVLEHALRDAEGQRLRRRAPGVARLAVGPGAGGNAHRPRHQVGRAFRSGEQPALERHGQHDQVLAQRLGA